MSTNLIITKKRTQPDREFKIINKNISNVKSEIYLGLTLDRSLTWAEHIKRITNIATGLISLYPMLKASRFPRRKSYSSLRKSLSPYYFITVKYGVTLPQHTNRRAISDAGWYTSNETIHQLLNMDYIKEVIIHRNKNLFKSPSDNENPLINEIPEYDTLESH
ncbi:hypothetical protein PR048_012043 [Dryococelus australis]|uniref:RNA-directed DNA polymerase n=1 Tax=Dryococelus australis TaxID=614101 RepID=A0ABQ9HNC8_9NEOP|nr:hypothetical protein PR048_012043 [Dryococelus australis]